MKQYWNFYCHGYDWCWVDRCWCFVRTFADAFPSFGTWIIDIAFPIFSFPFCSVRSCIRSLEHSIYTFSWGKSAETSLVRAIFLSTIQYHLLSLHIWFLRLLLFLTQWWNWYSIKGGFFDKRNEGNIHSRPFDSDIHAVNLAQGICENNIFFVQKIDISSVRTLCKYGIEWITFAECFVMRKGLPLQFMLNFVCLLSGSVAVAVLVFLHDECTTETRTNIHVCILDTGFLAEFDRVCK